MKCIYYFSYKKFKDRQNSLIVLDVRIVVTLGVISDWKGGIGDFWGDGNISFCDMGFMSSEYLYVLIKSFQNL